MSERVQVVTGLFDIGREFNDGRSISEYLTHLGALLSCCPDAIVFHDCIDQDFQSNHPSVKFIQLTLSELMIWGLVENISQICATYLDLGFSDLVYKNALYGVVFSFRMHVTICGLTQEFFASTRKRRIHLEFISTRICANLNFLKSQCGGIFHFCN